jgi:hypothetical protein
MRLKFKRNLHLILMFIVFLSFLTFAIGSLPIIAYSL